MKSRQMNDIDESMMESLPDMPGKFEQTVKQVIFFAVPINVRDCMVARPVHLECDEKQYEG